MLSNKCCTLCCKKDYTYDLGNLRFCRDHKPKIFKNPKNKNNLEHLKLKDHSDIYCDEENYVIVKDNKRLYHGEIFNGLKEDKLKKKVDEFIEKIKLKQNKE